MSNTPHHVAIRRASTPIDDPRRTHIDTQSETDITTATRPAHDPLQTQAGDGSSEPTPPHPNTGAAEDRRPIPRDCAAPVFIQRCISDQIDNSELGDGDPHTVVLIHGQSGSSLIWSRVGPLLHDCGLQLLAVNPPVHGDSNTESADGSDDADAIAQRLDRLSGPPAVIVAHCHGASTALHLAAIAPHHVRALVLISANVDAALMTAPDRVLAARFLGPALVWLGFRAAGLALHLPALRKRILTEGAGLEVSQAKEVVHRITYGTVWRAFLAEQRRVVADARRLQQRWGLIGCPVLLLAGKRDSVAGPRALAALARWLPDSDLITTDTGHLIPIEDPQSVLDAVLRILRRQYQQSRSPARTTP